MAAYRCQTWGSHYQHGVGQTLSSLHARLVAVTATGAIGMVSNEFIPSPGDPARPLPRPDRENTGVKPEIAKADKVARTGSADEKVRDTPPAGAWNDTTHD